jgi:hypothetical protein
MRGKRRSSRIVVSALMVAALLPMACGILRDDPEAGTLAGSPLDHLPPHITRLTDFGLRADWSPDGERLVFLDALAGDVWMYELASKGLEKLTGHFEHAGFSRAHYLSNGDLVLCGPAERQADNDDPEAGRFDGVLWVLPRPFDRAAIPLQASCWEGLAVARNRPRIGWVRSSIDYNKLDIVIQALLGDSELWVGDIAYRGGIPALVNRERVINRWDVSVAALLETQSFRPPSEEELIFTAFAHRGGEVMGVHLETGEIRNYSSSPWFDEADGIFPDGHSTLVARELAIVLLPGGLDIWRLSLDGKAHWQRLTHFSRYQGYGVSNSAVSPDGRAMVFQAREAGAEPGSGLGLLLFDFDRYSP